MTITNRGSTSVIVLSAASTFRVTFAPQKSGRVDGSISIVSEAPKQTLTIELSGTGRATGQLRITPGAIDFGKVNPGARKTQTGQLTASGASVTVSSATIRSEIFQLGGPSLPFTIPAGHTVLFIVTFVPRGSRTSSAILSFASDAKNSPTKPAVTVRMVGLAQHKVQLSWKASTSKHILG